MNEVQVVRINEMDSGLDRRKLDGEKEEELVDLVLQGVDDTAELARKLKMPFLTVQRHLRQPRMIGQIKQAIQARAAAMLPNTIERAYMDTNAKRASVRQAAREFIRKIAEGDEKFVIQNNEIQTWDPEYDERLFQKAQQLVRSIAEVEVATSED